MQDCNGVWDGSALVDHCGICDNNPGNDCTLDCNDVWGGTASIDDCGVCDENPANNNTTCVQDCNGIWNGTATTDDCGICDDDITNDNSTCTQDCLGEWGGPAYLDGCDLCVDVNTGAFPCTEVVEVTSLTGRIWMDRNLGASRPALSSSDSESYGYLFQWGRLNDGHQSRSSSTNQVPSVSDAPGHNEFIIVNKDWRDPQNGNLWQGLTGINNPCPPDFRIPTETELNNERVQWESNNGIGAFNSVLKLVSAGYRGPSAGTIGYTEDYGFYWASNTVNSANNISYSRGLYFHGTNASIGDYGRSKGFSVRCIKN